MADARSARRSAEKVAREALAGTLVGAAGELGVAQACRQEAADAVAEAEGAGRRLVQAAEAEARPTPGRPVELGTSPPR